MLNELDYVEKCEMQRTLYLGYFIPPTTESPLYLLLWCRSPARNQSSRWGFPGQFRVTVIPFCTSRGTNVHSGTTMIPLDITEIWRIGNRGCARSKRNKTLHLWVEKRRD